eukprot:TRINITY_DN28905_c0_g1_i1.p1 TRINITY_DN28905_c0_g1~~TRINITY_DN28905_c0_g1_i1.p1  ORF type:complete len:359 (+),score=78.65 TRINITY_DN28905_c0_g1_i1:176-1252(+)
MTGSLSRQVSQEKRTAGGKKRKHVEVSAVDHLVQHYADDWVQWEAHLNSTDGQQEKEDSRQELWEHVKQYKKKIDTWPQKERRKAFRRLYRSLRPAPQSGALSMMSSAPTVSSPLALPQLEMTPQGGPSLTGFSLLDDQIDLDALTPSAEAAAVAGPSSGPAPATASSVAAACVVAAVAAADAIEDFEPPSSLVVHQAYTAPPGVTVLAHHLPEFHRCESDQEVVASVRKIVDSDVNYLVNQRGGGHVAIGIDDTSVKGYFMPRKLRDKIRLAIDNQMSRWSPPPHMQRLVDARFVDVVSASGRIVSDHCVVWLLVSHSHTLIRNSRGDIARHAPVWSSTPDRSGPIPHPRHPAKRRW